jgi:cell division protein ZapA (FtsZ GTPase activity inhibitor)
MDTFFLINLSAVFIITSLLWYVYVSKLKSKLENLNQNIDREVLFKTDDNAKSLQNSVTELKGSIPKEKQVSYTEGFENGKSEFKEALFKSEENIKVLQDTVNGLRESHAKIKHESYLEGYQKGKSEFSVKVSPYRDEIKTGNDGLIFNDIYHEVMIGYQYQLLINGVPALKPAVIIEEYLIEEKREVDFAKIEQVTNLVESKIKSIAAESKGVMKYIK